MQKFSWFDTSTFHPTKITDPSGFRLILFSHIANIIPIFLAIKKILPIEYIILMTLQLLFSFLYHNFPFNKLARGFDWFFAFALIIYNIYFLFFQNSNNILIAKLFIIIPIFIFSIILFMQWTNYSKMHSMWHVLASFITSIVIW